MRGWRSGRADAQPAKKKSIFFTFLFRFLRYSKSVTPVTPTGTRIPYIRDRRRMGPTTSGDSGEVGDTASRWSTLRGALLQRAPGLRCDEQSVERSQVTFAFDDYDHPSNPSRTSHRTTTTGGGDARVSTCASTFRGGGSALRAQSNDVEGDQPLSSHTPEAAVRAG